MTSHTVNRPAATNHTICLWVTTDSLLCRSIKLRRRWLFTPAGVRYIHKESDKLQRSRTKHRLAVSQPKHDDTENRCLCPADRHSSTSTVFSADQKHENTILIKWFFFFFFYQLHRTQFPVWAEQWWTSLWEADWFLQGSNLRLERRLWIRSCHRSAGCHTYTYIHKYLITGALLTIL